MGKSHGENKKETHRGKKGKRGEDSNVGLIRGRRVFLNPKGGILTGAVGGKG